MCPGCHTLLLILYCCDYIKYDIVELPSNSGLSYILVILSTLTHLRAGEIPHKSRTAVSLIRAASKVHT